MGFEELQAGEDHRRDRGDERAAAVEIEHEPLARGAQERQHRDQGGIVSRTPAAAKTQKAHSLTRAGVMPIFLGLRSDRLKLAGSAR